MKPAVLAGLTSTLLFASSMLPMVVRAVRTRDLSSYSRSHLVLTNVGNLVHTAYIVSLPVGPVWLLHSVHAGVGVLMLTWHLRYGGNRSGFGAVGAAVRIDIWSDVVCPWCYIGKRRLERALAGRTDVEVVYHSFQLDSSAPRVGTETVADHLATVYGGGAATVQSMVDRVEALAAAEGLEFRNRDALWASTHDAHRLLHLALQQGGPALQGRLTEALMAAYFLQGRNPADHDVLVDAAADVGLDADRTRAVLGSDEFADAVETDIRQARAYGATGVPFFVVDGRYGISGAQPTEVFEQALRQADADAGRLVTVAAATDDACGPDGCAT